MKQSAPFKLIVTAWLIASFWIPAAKAQGVSHQIKNKWALVVGISKFKEPTSKLAYGAKDAQDFYDYLTTKGNFAADHVLLLLNDKADRDSVMGGGISDWLVRRVNPDDVLIIYLSTIGTPAKLDMRGVHYLVPYDGQIKALYSTGIAIDELGSLIKGRVSCRSPLLIVNASHSSDATFVRSGLVRSNAPPQKASGVAICACGSDQVAWDCKTSTNSVFNRRLIEALQVNGAGTTIGEAFAYLKTKVEADVQAERGTKQTPVLNGTDVDLSPSLLVTPPATTGT